nr:MAG TPA: hypothetical protein [Caudoviricetes sp.]
MISFTLLSLSINFISFFSLNGVLLLSLLIMEERPPPR